MNHVSRARRCRTIAEIVSSAAIAAAAFTDDALASFLLVMRLFLTHSHRE
jgi:hypothetical protein